MSQFTEDKIIFGRLKKNFIVSNKGLESKLSENFVSEGVLRAQEYSNE